MPLDSTTYETPVMNLLRRARALLSRRGAWTQGILATRYGEEVDPTENADAFCMLGALQHEVAGDKGDLYYEACRELARTIKPDDRSRGADAEGSIIPDYNDADHRQKMAILRTFDRTIARISALVTAA